MSRPDFFEPRPVFINFEERRKPVLKRRHGSLQHVESILGKRTIEEAFGCGMNDRARYGQEIPPDFFKNNHGHTVYPSREYYTYNKNTTKDLTHLYEDRIRYWRQKYSSAR